MTDEERARTLNLYSKDHARLLAMLAAVRADERERCARVCEHIKVFAETNPVAVLIRCAAAIRAMK